MREDLAMFLFLFFRSSTWTIFLSSRFFLKCYIWVYFFEFWSQFCTSVKSRAHVIRDGNKWQTVNVFWIESFVNSNDVYNQLFNRRIIELNDRMDRWSVPFNWSPVCTSCTYTLNLSSEQMNVRAHRLSYFELSNRCQSRIKSLFTDSVNIIRKPIKFNFQNK